MYQWRTGRSCVFKNHVHLVFVTKYRRDVFTAAMLMRIKELMIETCHGLDSELLEFNGEDDHVHFASKVFPPSLREWGISENIACATKPLSSAPKNIAL